MRIVKRILLLKKEDGVIVNLIKIVFMILTFTYCYLSIGVIVSYFKPSELPSAVNNGMMWLIYTISYLMLSLICVMALKIIEFIKKKFK